MYYRPGKHSQYNTAQSNMPEHMLEHLLEPLISVEKVR